MAASYVGSSGVTSGPGGSTASSLTVPLPAGSQAGHVAVLAAESLNSSTVDLADVPAGWTYPAGAADRNGGNGSSWLLYKQLTAADITAGSVTVDFTVVSQCLAELDVWSGVTSTGVLTATAVDTASNTSEPVPTIASVPAGAVFAAVFAYRSSAAVPDVGLIAGYSQGGRITAPDAAPYLSVESQWKTATAAGSYGGDTGTSPANCTGVAYAVAIPAAGSTPGQGAGTASWSVTATGTGERTPVGTAVASWSVTATGVGSAPPGSPVIHDYGTAVLASDGVSTATLAGPALVTAVLHTDD